MECRLERKNGEVIILNEKELNSVFRAARIAWNKDYIYDMLVWKGFDVENLSDEQIEIISEKFIDRMVGGESLGDLEAIVFDVMMEEDFPEIKKEDK